MAAVFVLAVGYSPNSTMGIAFLCIGVGITGVNATGYAVNLLDIAPRFAGVIMGITNVFGSLPGFLSPQIVGIITVNKVRLCLTLKFHWDLTNLQYVLHSQPCL